MKYYYMMIVHTTYQRLIIITPQRIQHLTAKSFDGLMMLFRHALDNPVKNFVGPVHHHPTNAFVILQDSIICLRALRRWVRIHAQSS